VIRQAISCDICGAEKKQTNHWFVAFEQTGELRIGGWSSRNRLRSGSKHLCGQTCLHKLVDEFMARNIAGRPVASANPAERSEAESTRAEIDASLTSPAAFAEAHSSARLTVPAASDSPPAANLPASPPAAVVSMPVRPLCDLSVSIAAPPLEDPPVYSSRRWRAEAWERERSRELRAVEHHPEILRRRKGF
jgi:hypothetical protein